MDMTLKELVAELQRSLDAYGDCPVEYCNLVVISDGVSEILYDSYIESEETYDDEPWDDLEMGFDPYLGDYSYDC